MCESSGREWVCVCVCVCVSVCVCGISSGSCWQMQQSDCGCRRKNKVWLSLQQESHACSPFSFSISSSDTLVELRMNLGPSRVSTLQPMCVPAIETSRTYSVTLSALIAVTHEPGGFGFFGFEICGGNYAVNQLFWKVKD